MGRAELSMSPYRLSLPPPHPLPPPPLFQAVSLDGLAHQLEIIRMSCSLVLLNAALQGSRVKP